MDKIKSSLGQAEFEVPKGETGYRETLAYLGGSLHKALPRYHRLRRGSMSYLNWNRTWEPLADDTEGRARRRAAEAVPSVEAIAGGG
jgi:hypothetical protein